jgi:endonuclease/exonuclease/phosphatase (EEP) superfamily protein YafD
MLPLAACAFGIYLGMNFNVVVLAAASLACTILLGLVAYSSGAGLFDGATWAILNIFVCQAGYMLGLTAREPVAQFMSRMKIRQSKRI